MAGQIVVVRGTITVVRIIDSAGQFSTLEAQLIIVETLVV